MQLGPLAAPLYDDLMKKMTADPSIRGKTPYFDVLLAVAPDRKAEILGPFRTGLSPNVTTEKDRRRLEKFLRDLHEYGSKGLRVSLIPEVLVLAKQKVADHGHIPEAAIDYLGDLGPLAADALPVLEALRRDVDGDIASAAAASIRRIQKK